jgi:ferredoxin
MRATELPGCGPEHVKLAKKFGAVKVMGPPPSDALLAVLAHLFTRDEARVALHLSFLRPRTAESLARKTGLQQAELTALLEEMCRKRAIIRAARHYMLYPLIPGTFENILRTGEDGPWHRRYAELVNGLFDTGYLREYFTRPVNAIRSIPIREAVEDQSLVAGEDLVSEMIDFHTDFAVLHACACRQSMHLTGHECRRAAPSDGCLTFGAYSRGIVAEGNGRAVDKSEMREIVAARREKNLVFFTSDAVPTLQTAICTCCDCCCHALGIINGLGGKLAAPSHFLARVDAAKCTNCGRCIPPCNTHAHVLLDKKHVFDPAKCIGCGNCVAACERAAIVLVENERYRPPARTYRRLILRILPPVLRMGLGIKLRRAFRRSSRA